MDVGGMVRMVKKRKAIWQEAPFLVGGILTIGVLAIAGLSLATGEMCDQIGRCTSKWDVLLASPPNEFGDALAGFAGTLAFVWLIVTVWLQATELREQREEFEKMANAQEDQVKLLVQQGKIFADEQRQRTESEAAVLLEAQISSCLKFFDTSGPAWHYLSKNSSGGSSKGTVWLAPEFVHDGVPSFRKFEIAVNMILDSCLKIFNFQKRSEITEFPSQIRYLNLMIERIEAILATMDDASKAKTLWLEDLNLELFVEELKKLQRSQYWDQ